jgi:hypothetical protein
MPERTPSAMTLKCFMLTSIVMLDGPPTWSNEFDIVAYERARKHSIFPAEYTMSATELTTRSNGIKNGNTVSYIRKHERKKLTLTVVESSNDQSRVGYSVTAIKTESAYAYAHRLPGKPDYSLERATNNIDDAERVVFLSENAWNLTQFDRIQFDTSSVSDDVFDLANIGYKDPSRSQRFRLWIYLVGFVLVFLLFVLRKRKA